MSELVERVRFRCCLCIVLFAPALQTQGAEYFVATDGTDSNSGTQAKPFRTIQKAADIMKPGDTCYVRGGVYRQTVRLERSGSKDKSIRFTACPGEAAVLSGTEPVRGDWSVHKGRIYKTRVTEAYNQLFVDGKMMVEARWPNMRFEERFDKKVWATAGKGSRYGTMVDPALAETGIDWTGAVATLNVGQWQTWRREVRNHRPGSDSFNYDQDLPSRLKTKRRWEGFDRYFLSGKLEALDSPGEWFLDKHSQTLYLWTPDGTNPKGRRVEGKIRSYAFIAKDVSYVVLSGLHFFATTFKFERAKSCIIDNVHLLFPTCVKEPFRATSGGVVWPDEPEKWNSRHWFGETSIAAPSYVGGRNNKVINCSIRYTQGPAITLQGTENTIENCLMHDIDWYGLDTGLGVDMLGSAPSVIRHCTIFNIGSSEGIRLSNNGPTLVEYNYIHHGGLCQSDGALVQAATPGVAGTEVRFNWVHNHDAFNWGGNGIRGDNQTRGLLVHHNVVWNCREKGIITKGDNNKVFNNTCLGNPKIDILLPRNSLPGRTDELRRQNLHSQAVNNFAPAISGTYIHEKPRQSAPGEVHNNYSGPAPMLADAAGRDFRPRAGSPLIDAGRHLGGITDGYRGKAPDIGAYEFGGEGWLPGCRNGLWISAPEKQADGTVAIRIALRMPPTESVSLAVKPGNRKVKVKSGEMLRFTPANWMYAQAVTLSGYEKTAGLQFSDKHLGDAEISVLGGIDGRKGQVVGFDRPMLPGEPVKFID